MSVIASCSGSRFEPFRRLDIYVFDVPKSIAYVYSFVARADVWNFGTRTPVKISPSIDKCKDIAVISVLKTS